MSPSARTHLTLAVACILLFAAPAVTGQELPPEETPPADPQPAPPPVTIAEPEPPGVETITIHVPAPKPAPAKPKPTPRIASAVSARVRAPAPARREPVRREQPADEESYEPYVPPVAAPIEVPRRTVRTAVGAKAKAVRARTRAKKPAERLVALQPSERRAAAWTSAVAPAVPARVEPWQEAGVLGATAGSPALVAEDGGGLPLLVLVLAVLGLLTLGIAAGAPLLASYRPDVFVPLVRSREDISFVGLCLLGSGLLAWAVVAGI
jgi:hypothetical protein